MLSPVLGLTGPTGAGKSTVAAALKKLGCAVIDADRLAREATAMPECLAALQKEFGADIVGEDGALDRRLLAGRAFANPERTETLNRIIHPVVIRESVRRLREARETGCLAVILDAPLLFESGADSLCDTTVAVVAPDASRAKRIMARDGITAEQAEERMRAQHGISYYAEHADYTFDGTVGWDAFDGAVKALLERILGDLNEKT